MRAKKSPLTPYRERRNTKKSGEPTGNDIQKKSQSIFVVQKHQSSHLHYDFRLAIDGVLVSWAVPKGPSRRAGVKRLAVQTDDHPLSYATFEGTIPQENYGAGTVTIWDHGTYANNATNSMKQQLKSGQLEFELQGTLLRGNYVLIRMKDSTEKWLLIKQKNRTTQ